MEESRATASDVGAPEVRSGWRRRFFGWLPTTARGVIGKVAVPVLTTVLGAVVVAKVLADDGPKPVDRATVEAKATSHRAPYRSADGNVVLSYGPNNVLDTDNGSAWIEGAAGPGKGETIAFTFERKLRLTKSKLRNGYGRTPRTQDSNNRVRRAVLSDRHGHRQIVTLADTSRPRSIKIDSKLSSTKTLNLTILTVYPGSYDAQDTGLSDVRFYAR